MSERTRESIVTCVKVAGQRVVRERRTTRKSSRIQTPKVLNSTATLGIRPLL